LWILTAPIVVIVVLFAVSNLDSVTLHLFPLPYDLTVRLYLLTLITLFMGFVLGSIVTWVADRKRRRETRLQARRLQELEHELTLTKLRAAEAEKRLAEAAAAPLETVPLDAAPVPPVLAE
jgi:uncharacterized integral membrane protein